MYSIAKFLRKVEVVEAGCPSYRLAVPGLPTSTYWLCEESCHRLRDSGRKRMTVKAFVDTATTIIEERGGHSEEWPDYMDLRRNSEYLLHIAQALSDFDDDFCDAILRAAYDRGFDWYTYDYLPQSDWPDEVADVAEKWCDLCRSVLEDEAMIKHFGAALARRSIEELNRILEGGANYATVIITQDSDLLMDIIKEIAPTMAFPDTLPPLRTELTYCRSTGCFMIE